MLRKRKVDGLQITKRNSCSALSKRLEKRVGRTACLGLKFAGPDLGTSFSTLARCKSTFSLPDSNGGSKLGPLADGTWSARGALPLCSEFEQVHFKYRLIIEVN